MNGNGKNKETYLLQFNQIGVTCNDQNICNGEYSIYWRGELKPLIEKREKLQTFDSKKRVIENDISHLRISQKAHDRMSCEYEESDDELHTFLLNHDKQILNKEKELEIVNKKYEKLKIEMNKQVNELHAKRGKIEQIKVKIKIKKSK